MFGQYGQSGARAQQFRRNTAGKRGQLFAAAIACFSAALILLVTRLCVHGSPRIYCFLFSVLLLGAGLYFLRMWKRSVESLTVEEALQQDTRPPILYLRPFKADKIRFSSWRQRRVAAAKFLAFVAYILFVGWLVALVLGLYRLMTGQSDVDALASTKPSAEEFLVSLLDPLGPVIAIGRPGEKIPPVGAARMYLGDEWKDVVQDLLKQSQLILMFAGTTNHFGWELQRVFQNDPFVPTILILPFFQRYRQPEVDRFVGMFAEATGLHLSSDLRKTRAVFSSKASEVVEIRDLGTADDRALNDLNPFLGPIAQIMEKTGRLGWTEGYIEEARSGRVSDRRWLYGTAVALVFFSLGSFWIFRRAEQKQREGEIAYQFFADAFQNINPCADPKLAAQVPDPDACTKIILNDIWRKADLCADWRLATIFLDPDSCHFAALRAYRASAVAKRK